MRILHLTGDRSLPREPDGQGASGVVRSALEIARAQVSLGHRVEIAGIGNESWRARWRGVRLRLFKFSPWARLRLRAFDWDFRTHLPYVAYTLGRTFDVVHGHNYPYLRFLRSPVRVAHVQMDPFYAGVTGPRTSFSPADFETVRRASSVQVAPGSFVANQLQRGMNGRGNVHIVHNGVDSERFDAIRQADTAGQLRASLGLARDSVAVLFSGAIVPEKGVIHLARAFADGIGRWSQAHLVVAGASSLWGGAVEAPRIRGEYECSVRDALQPLISEGRVHFLGTVAAEDMPGAYAASDLVVVPSVWEDPFPLAALEALASSRPVIAARIGGLPEIVNRENGILVDPGNEPDLECALGRLIGDSDLRRRLGENGRRQALGFSWESAARQLDEIYKGVQWANAT